MTSSQSMRNGNGNQTCPPATCPRGWLLPAFQDGITLWTTSHQPKHHQHINQMKHGTIWSTMMQQECSNYITKTHMVYHGMKYNSIRTSECWQNSTLAATASQKPTWTGGATLFEMIFYKSNDKCGNMQSHHSLWLIWNQQLITLQGAWSLLC